MADPITINPEAAASPSTFFRVAAPAGSGHEEFEFTRNGDAWHKTGLSEGGASAVNLGPAAAGEAESYLQRVKQDAPADRSGVPFKSDDDGGQQPPTSSEAGVAPAGIADMASRAWDDVKEFASNAPSEVGRAIVKGTRDFLSETVHHVQNAIIAGATMPKVNDNGEPYEGQPAPMDPADIKREDPIPKVVGPETGTGRFIADAVQFVEGMATLGRVVAPIAGAGTVAKGVEMALRGGVVQGTFFDPYKDRLGNLIQEYPSLQNPVAEFLAANPDDPEALARLKNALEGVGMGAALEVTARGIVAVAHAMRGNIRAAAQAASEIPTSGVQEPHPVLNPETTPQRPANAPQSAPEAPAGVQVRVVAEGAPEGSYSGAPGTRPIEADARVAPAAEPAVTFTPREVAETADALLSNYTGRMSASDFRALPDDASLVNLNYLTNPQARASLMTTLSERVGAVLEREGLLTPQSTLDWRADAQAFAREMGVDPDAYLARLAGARQDLIEARKIDLATRMMVAGIEARLRRIAQFHTEGRPGNFGSMDEMYAAAEDLARSFMDLTAGSKLLGAEAGRMLKNRQIVAPQSTTIATAVTNAQTPGGNAVGAMLTQIAAAPRQDARSISTLVSATAENLAQAAPEAGEAAAEATARAAAAAERAGRPTQRLASYYINSLLGYKTVAIQMTSDFLKGGVLMPTEQAYRGIYRGATTGDWTQFLQAGSQVSGMLHTILDTLPFAGRSVYTWSGRAFREGQSFLDAEGHGLLDGVGMPSRMYNTGIIEALDRGDYGTAIASSLGRTVSMPSRLINTMNEFSQQVIYRGRVYGKAMTEARLRGLDGPELQSFIQQRLDGAFDSAGRALDEEALAYAREGTQSTPLDPNSFAGGVQRFANNHPAARLILPFIKAPANLMRDVYEYTPGIKTIVDARRGEFAAGGERAEIAAAKLMTGATLWAGATSLVLAGRLTDGGPLDKAAREEMMQTGWRPHSFVFTDSEGTKHYLPLERIDPFGQILSMAADAAMVMSRVGEEDAKSLGLAMAAYISKDTLSKNYLKNFADLVDTLGSIASGGDAEKAFTQLTQSMAGGLVPSQLAATVDDPIRREVHGMIQAMKARIPGLSESLDRKYNVLGEPYARDSFIGPDLVSPFSIGVENDDPVHRVLTHIAVNSPPGSFNPPPKTMRLQDTLKTPGVDLTAIKSVNGHSAYDRFQELVGNVGGVTLREQLTAMMKANPEFWFSPDPDGNHDVGGKRLREINAVISERRLGAKAALIKETPELRQALQADAQRGASVLKHGGNADPGASAPGMKTRP